MGQSIVDFNKQLVQTADGPRAFGYGYKYVTANYKGAFFHCETSSVESGLRIVEHEFPKKMLPYAESMGHKAISWSVRAYIATFPYDSADNVLNTTDYTRGRDELARALDSNNPGWLQIHTMPPLYVQCQRWRLTETEKQGGYCTFDIEFIEYGLQPFQYTTDAYTAVQSAIDNLRTQLVAPGQPWAPPDIGKLLAPLVDTTPPDSTVSGVTG